MRFACPGNAARITIAVLLAAAVTLWTFLAARDGHVRPEEYSLIGWTAITVTLSLVAFVIGMVMRDSIRASLLRAMVPSQPDAGTGPLRLVKAEQDAG